MELKDRSSKIYNVCNLQYIHQSYINNPVTIIIKLMDIGYSSTSHFLNDFVEGMKSSSIHSLFYFIFLVKGRLHQYKITGFQQCPQHTEHTHTYNNSRILNTHNYIGKALCNDLNCSSQVFYLHTKADLMSSITESL